MKCFSYAVIIISGKGDGGRRWWASSPKGKMLLGTSNASVHDTAADSVLHLAYGGGNMIGSFT